jgi:hypothetical protein
MIDNTHPKPNRDKMLRANLTLYYDCPKTALRKVYRAVPRGLDGWLTEEQVTTARTLFMAALVQDLNPNLFCSGGSIPHPGNRWPEGL